MGFRYPSSVREAVAGDLEWDVEPRGYDPPEAPVDVEVWDSKNSRVVSGPVGTEKQSKFPGRRFHRLGDARKYWREKGYRIVREHLVSGRYIFWLLPVPVAAVPGVDG